MTRRTTLIVVAGTLATVLATLAGCSALAERWLTPQPPEPPNARFERHLRSAEADAVVVGEIERAAEFAQTQKGVWVTHHWLVVARVTEVIEGQFEKERLVFVVRDKWPTPESGIMLGKATWLFRPGWVLRLRLLRGDRANGELHTIIGAERYYPDSAGA